MCKGPESKDCISCLLTRFFDNGTCVIQCDPGKYQRDGQCHLCHHTCLECKNEGPDKCTRCGEDRYGVERYLFEGECRDSCPEGYYHSSSGTCDPCPPNCTVCISTGHCLYCAPSYYPTDGKCVKLQCGEGVDPDQEDCVTCEEGCEKCLSVNPVHCMSCLPGYYQLGSSCRKMCPARTFEDELSMRCARCDDHCVTCDDSECYLCDDGFLLSDGTCVETCPEGFYSDMKQECEPCHSMCRSCGGPNLDDCDSCEDNMSLKDGQCIGKSKITCSDGFFPNVGCEQCHSSCKSCLGPEEDQCDSCHEGIFLTNSQTCVSACPAGTHGNQTSGRCEDCSAGCVVCQDAHHCLKCKAAFSQLYLQDGKCVAECTRGYPEDDACVSCATGCASCEGEANNCLSCDEDYLRFKHTCVQHCPNKHFVKDGVCERCPAHCTQCDQTQKCSECAEYYFLHEDGCHDDCPEGFFTNVQEKRCERCHSDCSTCDGPDPDDCISCKSSWAARYNGKCLNKCPSDTYLDETECRDCDRSCLTCSGPGPSSCLTCRTDMRKDVNGHCVFLSDCSPHTFTDKNGKCRPCHPTCLHCSGAGKEQCITCDPKHFLLNQTCVTTCPGGYHGDEERQECVSCHKNCASCSGHHSNECLTCKPDLFLHGHSCVSTCPNSYFVNSSNGACQACDHTCEHCSGSSGFCLSCRDGYFLMTTSGLCLHTCPSHYFPDTDRKCTHCHPTCKTCSDSGAVFCTSCYEGYEMFAGICTSRCLSGQYLTNDTCVACDQSCTECKGPGPYNCTRCPALQRLTEDGRCLSCCGENTFRHSRFPWECCVCDELDDECIVGLNHDFFSKEPLPSVRPGLVVFTVIFVLVSLWFAIFYFLHFRRRITSKPVLKTNGYAKIPDGPFTSASLKDSIHPEYRDKDQDQEEDEDEEDDIVYMGRDGIVYRKFKYSMLEEDEPEEEAEYEYEDEMYTFK